MMCSGCLLRCDSNLAQGPAHNNDSNFGHARGSPCRGSPPPHERALDENASCGRRTLQVRGRHRMDHGEDFAVPVRLPLSRAPVPSMSVCTVLPRKTVSDLAQSIRSGRWNEQLSRLYDAGYQIYFFLIEGDLRDENLVISAGESV